MPLASPSAKIHKQIEYSDEDKCLHCSLKTEDGDYLRIRSYSTLEIFGIPNTKPIVQYAKSRSGKSVICTQVCKTAL